MRFIDEVTVQIYGGKGGDGSIGWRREKYVPMGGPDGGNGGAGGAVIFRTDPGLNTLIDLSFSPIIRAGGGEAGQGGMKEGKDGENAIVDVPVGTQVYFDGRLVADLSAPGAQWIAARGGIGGKGNSFFKSSTNQSPDYAQRGQPGEERSFRLVLKSVADVGLVGLPNVGKSTLISSISKATPKVADYPFTTLEPHLGVVTVGEHGRFVIADIPGLIPGAHQGKGLGIQFLKHIERTSVLVQIIDATQIDGAGDEGVDLAAGVREQFEAIDRELAAFSESLALFPRIVVFSKADVELCREAHAASVGYFAERRIATYLISSVTGAGLDVLVNALLPLVEAVRSEPKKPA